MKKTLMREKTIAVLLFAILAMSFMGVFVSAEFPWTTSLTTKLLGTSSWSTQGTHVYYGFYSVHLTTGPPYAGPPWQADEARYVVTLPPSITLGDIYQIDWMEFLVKGYPPHLDIILDLGGGVTDALVFEYAYNGPIGTTQPTYGALTGTWYQTFHDSTAGASVIDGNAYCWLSSGPAGGPSIIGGKLNAWKAGGITGGLGIDATTPVLRLEFEIDNWMTQTEAYIDDVFVNGLDIMGVFGPKGDTGATGPRGYTGATGPVGPQGSYGVRGPAGDQGVPGLDGLDGEQGPQGVPGEVGETGLMGLEGPQGESIVGPQGLQGETGEEGPKGETGSEGPQGEAGAVTFAYVGAAFGGISLLALIAQYMTKK